MTYSPQKISMVTNFDSEYIFSIVKQLTVKLFLKPAKNGNNNNGKMQQYF